MQEKRSYSQDVIDLIAEAMGIEGVGISPVQVIEKAREVMARGKHEALEEVIPGVLHLRRVLRNHGVIPEDSTPPVLNSRDMWVGMVGRLERFLGDLDVPGDVSPRAVYKQARHIADEAYRTRCLFLSLITSIIGEERVKDPKYAGPDGQGPFLYLEDEIEELAAAARAEVELLKMCKEDLGREYEPRPEPPAVATIERMIKKVQDLKQFVESAPSPSASSRAVVSREYTSERVGDLEMVTERVEYERATRAMTLDEAIEHAKEMGDGEGQCAEQHAQLEGWLTELKILRADLKRAQGSLRQIAEALGRPGYENAPASLVSVAKARQRDSNDLGDLLTFIKDTYRRTDAREVLPIIMKPEGAAYDPVVDNTEENLERCHKESTPFQRLQAIVLVLEEKARRQVEDCEEKVREAERRSEESEEKVRADLERALEKYGALPMKNLMTSTLISSVIAALERSKEYREQLVQIEAELRKISPDVTLIPFKDLPRVAQVITGELKGLREHYHKLVRELTDAMIEHCDGATLEMAPDTLGFLVSQALMKGARRAGRKGETDGESITYHISQPHDWADCLDEALLKIEAFLGSAETAHEWRSTIKFVASEIRGSFTPA